MKSVALVATLLFVAASAMRPCELPNCYRPYRYHGPAHDEDSLGYARHNAPRPVYADEDDSLGMTVPRRHWRLTKMKTLELDEMEEVGGLKNW